MSLSRDATTLVFGRITGQAFAFLLTASLVRVLSPEQFGIFATMMLVGTTSSLLGDFGLTETYLFFVPRLAPRQKTDFIFRGLRQQLLISLPASCISAAASAMLVKGAEDSITASSIAAWLIFPVGNIALRALETIFLSLERTRLSVGVSVSASFLTATGAVTAALLADSPTLTFGAVGLAQIICTVSWLAVLVLSQRKVVAPADIPPTPEIDTRSQLRYALSLWSARIAGTLNRQFDAFVVSSFWSPSVFASYRVGSKELPVVASVSGQLTATIIPRLTRAKAENNLKEALELWHWVLSRASMVIFPVFVFALVEARELIVLLYTDTYADAVLVFTIYLCLLPLRVVTYGRVLTALGNPRSVMWCSLTSFALNVVLSLVLIRPLGWTGPAVASIAAQVYAVVYLTIYIKKALQVPLGQLVPWRRCAAIALFSTAPVLFLDFLPSGSSFALLLRLTGFTVIYFSIMFATKMLTPSDLKSMFKKPTLEGDSPNAKL